MVFQGVLADGVDAGAAGAFLEGLAEFGKVFRWAGGDYFYVAVVGVFDPAAQVELGGFAVDEPTEAYALDTAADEEVVGGHVWVCERVSSCSYSSSPDL